MPTTRSPRRGSLQFWPRSRSKRQYARIRSWASGNGLLAFPGYKAGMVRALYYDTEKKSPTFNETVVIPCTVLECPPLKIFSVRFYKNSLNGLQCSNEIRNSKLDKFVARKVTVSKKTSSALPESAEGFSEIRVVVQTQPHKTGIGKKKPELFEASIGGTVQEQLNFAKENLDKEIAISQVFKNGLFVDIHGVNTGKGVQGSMKRFGTKRKRHKSEKGVRRNIVGAEGMMRVLHTPPHPGKMGFHLRTQYNNWILQIIEKPEFKPFNNYGIVKNSCVIIKGSLPGPKNRLLTITRPIRAQLKEKTVPQLRII